MTRRLISLREFAELEGLVKRHRSLLERLELLEADAAAFDVPAQGALELSRKADTVRRGESWPGCSSASSGG